MIRENVIQLDHDNIMATYGKLDLVPEEGHGATLTDKNGKSYIDFTSGIGVNIFGWNDEGWKNAVIDQVNRYQHVSNYFYCDKASELASMIAEKTGLSTATISRVNKCLKYGNEGYIKALERVALMEKAERRG